MFALDARQVTKHEGLTTDYETAALPAELRRHLPSKKFVDSNWLEVCYTCGDMSIGVWGYTTKRLCQLF